MPAFANTGKGANQPLTPAFRAAVGTGDSASRYATEPQPHCHDRQVIAPRGKVLGGSSAINGLIYIRGQAADFDHWRQLGNVGWSYEDVLPYFRKAEDNERGADAFHGAGGPLGVSDARDRHPLAEAFSEAAQQCCYPSNG